MARVLTACWVLTLVAACAAGPSNQEETTPKQEEPLAETEMVKTLEELAAKPPAPEAEQGKPALGEPHQATKMCSRGKCPTGYMCGSAPGRPRKVCYKSEAYRPGPTGIFKQ
jgi:hypothetical protein